MNIRHMLACIGLVLPCGAADQLSTSQTSKPALLVKQEQDVAAALDRHRALLKAGSTNLSDLTLAHRRVFREASLKTVIEAREWADNVLMLRAEVLTVAVESRDTTYDLSKEDGFQIKVMPPVTPEQPDVYPGMAPELVRDSRTREEYQRAIIENERRRLKWEHENEIDDLVGFGVFVSATWVQMLYPEAISPEAAMVVVKRFVKDEYLLRRFEREFSKRSPGTWRKGSGGKVPVPQK